MVHGTVSISAAATAAAVDAAHARLREQRSYHRGFDATNPVPGDPRASSDLNVAAAAWIRGQAPRDNTDCVWFKYWLPFCGARGWTPSLGATTDPPHDDAWCLFGAHLAQLRLAGTTIMTYGFALIRRFRQRFGVVPAAPRFRELLAHVKAVKIPPGGLEARDARRRTPADLRHVSAIVNDDTLDLALRAAVVAIFFSLARPQELVVGDGLAWSTALNRIRGTKTDGTKEDIWFRTTMCFRKSGGDWRIVHDHSSTPFYMDGSLRAAVDLKPVPNAA